MISATQRIQTYFKGEIERGRDRKEATTNPHINSKRNTGTTTLNDVCLLVKGVTGKVIARAGLVRRQYNDS